MAETPAAIAAVVGALTQPEARGRLLALGLARGMVWRDGVVPEGAPDFPVQLTDDLLDFGYGLLALGLELRDANRELATVNGSSRRTKPSGSRRKRWSLLCAAEAQKIQTGVATLLYVQRRFTWPAMRRGRFPSFHRRRLT